MYIHEMLVIMPMKEKFHHIYKCSCTCNVDVDEVFMMMERRIVHFPNAYGKAKMPMIMVHAKRNKNIHLQMCACLKG